MTAEEAIKIIEIAIAEVEWEYPMEYAVAFETAIEALEKAEEYKCLEEQGRLIKLPCAIGDTVWFNTYKRGERMGVQSHKVEEVRVRVLIERDYAEPYTEIPDYEFGKTVFLTREEAERKLKEMGE